MAQLFLIQKENQNHKQAQLLCDQLVKAETFVRRGVGLLSRKSLSPSEALWIKPCNNIHTFFMRFSIDCIFIDSQFRVQKLYKNVKPFRFAGPVWKATSVIETPAGQIDKWQLNLGDQVYVVD